MEADVVIVGGGPGGASCALALAGRGIRTVLIEKDTFPRYHIGESMTGECGKVVRDFGLEQAMIDRGYPVKYGVRVFVPSGEESFWVPVMGRHPEDGLFETTTWQVPRAEFDALLLETARERGAVVVDGEAVAVLRDGEAVTGVRLRTAGGEELEVRARCVVDASGPACFLSRAGVLGRKERGRYDNQVAIFSQVTGAVRDPGKAHGNTLIFCGRNRRWAWFIPLDDEVVSLGVVVPAEQFKEAGLSKADFLRETMLEVNDDLTRRLGDVTFVEEARAVSNYSYDLPRYTGPGYLCVGDAHRFIDPVFSFGLQFAMKEGQLAAEAIERWFAGEADVDEKGNPFLAYQELTTRGMDVIQDLIDAFWERPAQFALVVHKKFRDDTIDLFAGRVYGTEPSPALLAIRQVLAKARGTELANAAAD